MPKTDDGLPSRQKLDKLTVIQNWVNATDDAWEEFKRRAALKVKGNLPKNKAKKQGRSSRNPPSHSPSSAIDQLGQLSLQGEPSPIDAPLPASTPAPIPVPVPVPVRASADAPPGAPKNLAAASHSPAPHDHAGPSRMASVGHPFPSPKFYVEMTHRKVPKVTASSGKQPRRCRQISPSPSRSPEYASPHVEPSDAHDEQTNAAKIAALEQRFASFEAQQAARQAELDKWIADVEVWMADMGGWRRRLA